MKIHIVQVSDTINRIAKKYDVDIEEIKKHNRQINNFKSIAPGMKLKIPVLTQTVEEELKDNNPSVENFYPSLDDITAYEEQEVDPKTSDEKVEINNKSENDSEAIKTIYNKYPEGSELVNKVDENLEIEGYTGTTVEKETEIENHQTTNQQVNTGGNQYPYYMPNHQYMQPSQYNTQQPQYQQPMYPANQGYYVYPNQYRSGGPCPCQQQMSPLYQQPYTHNQVRYEAQQNQGSQLSQGVRYNQPMNQVTSNANQNSRSSNIQPTQMYNQAQFNTDFNQHVQAGPSSTVHNPALNNQAMDYFDPNMPFNLPYQQGNGSNQVNNQPASSQTNMAYTINPNPYVNMGDNQGNNESAAHTNYNGSTLPYQSNIDEKVSRVNQQVNDLFRKMPNANTGDNTYTCDTDGFTITKTKKKIQADLRKRKKE